MAKKASPSDLIFSEEIKFVKKGILFKDVLRGAVAGNVVKIAGSLCSIEVINSYL